MKVLMITNLYPPFYLGGYEQLCGDVAEGLKQRGHEIFVLTSRFGSQGGPEEERIYRELSMDINFYSYRTRGSIVCAVANHRAFHRTLDRVRPDILFIWNMENLGRHLLQSVETAAMPALYHHSAPWVLSPDRLTTIARHLNHLPWLGDVLVSRKILYDHRRLSIDNSTFSCEFLRRQIEEAGVLIRSGEVVYEGIPLELFPPRDHDSEAGAGRDRLELIYGGQLVRHKGVHTAILAIADLIRRRHITDIHLSVYGTGEEQYIQYLRSLVDQHGLENFVTMHPPVPRKELGRILHRHQVLIFPSIWEEPWSLMLLLGMACGLAVVGTFTGGSRELLVNEKNCLLFGADDAQSLADQIQRLLVSPDLRLSIARTAQEEVQRGHGMSNMVEKIEQILLRCVAQKKSVLPWPQQSDSS